MDTGLANATPARPGDLITVFGGSGFIGRHLVQALAKRGYRVRVAVRRPNMALFLRPMGDVGQVTPFPANIRQPQTVAAAVDGASAVVNLVGILHQQGAQTFEAVQANAPGEIARLASEAGVGHFIQMSAIGADADSDSHYARSKGLGEQAVLEHIPGATVVRPSIVFGPEDDFFNRFAAMAGISPALPLIGGGQTRFQPVYVKDVATAVVQLLESSEAAGKTYEFGGPEVHSFKALMQIMLEIIDRPRLLVPIPFGVAGLMGTFAQLLPGAPLTADQVRLLRSDNVVADLAEGEGRTLRGLGIPPTALRAILPSYLYAYRKGGEFAEPTQKTAG